MAHDNTTVHVHYNGISYYCISACLVSWCPRFGYVHRDDLKNANQHCMVVIVLSCHCRTQKINSSRDKQHNKWSAG